MQNRELAENIARALHESGFLVEELENDNPIVAFNAIICLIENELDYSGRTKLEEF